MKRTSALLIIGFCMLNMKTVFADNMSCNEIAPPKTHSEVLNVKVPFNDQDLNLVRFQRDGSEVEWGSEHYSYLLDQNNRLIGYMRKDLSDGISNAPLENADEAEQIAKSFLSKCAADLLNDMRVLWVRPHSEPVIDNGAEREITGMKVKAFSAASGKYFWVIIDANGQIMNFERDIIWLTFPNGHRGTEKWIYDEWAKEKLCVKGDCNETN